MKKYLAFMILASAALLGHSQEGGEENPETKVTQESDTTKINLGGDTQLILVSKGDEIDVSFKDHPDSTRVDHDEDDDNFTYWAGVDLGFTGVFVDEGAQNEWFDIREQNSSALSVNFVEKKIKLFKHYVGINTGLGATYQDYAFSDTLSVVNMNDTIMGVSSGGIKYSKNKLKTGYLKIPLLLEINTSKKSENNFHVAAGLIGGWNFRSTLKQQFEVEGDKTRLKTKGDYNINPWSLEATVRAGYGKFNVFATASLTDLFEDGKGPKVQPFTVGVTLVNF